MVPIWGYFAADFLLLQLAILLVWQAPAAPGKLRWITVGALVLTAGVLGVAACLQARSSDPEG